MTVYYTRELLIHTGQAVGWYRCDGANCPICSIGIRMTPAQSKESLAVAAQAQAFVEAYSETIGAMK